MSKRPQITTYPSPALKQAIEQIAADQGRSASNLLIVWAKERPEVQDRLSGVAQ